MKTGKDHPPFHAESGILKEAPATQDSEAERPAALGRVVAEITHDIKNPLLIIGAYARQLVRTAPDEKSREKLNIIAGEVERLEKLLGNINAYYLPRNLKLEKLDINALLREACLMASQGAPERNIQVRCRVKDDPAWVEGDRDRLKEVFFNLVRNSIDALISGGTLFIDTERDGDRIEIHFRDNGPGISERDLSRAFIPFFTTKSQGTGLGLAICKRIIEAHSGGSIRLSSQEGKGTEVIITMLLRPQPEQRA